MQGGSPQNPIGRGSTEIVEIARRNFQENWCCADDVMGRVRPREVPLRESLGSWLMWPTACSMKRSKDYDV